MFNKRGQGLQVSTVILIILALLVLVILAVIVTGGFAQFAEKLGIVKASTLSVSETKLKCQSWCDSKNAKSYCEELFFVDPETNLVYTSGGAAPAYSVVYACGTDSSSRSVANSDLGIRCPGLCQDV